MTTNKKAKPLVVVQREVYNELDFKDPHLFYIVDWNLNRVYVPSCRDRMVAQQRIDEEYGAGLYSVRVSRTVDDLKKKLATGTAFKYARGTATRKGQKKY